MADLHRLLEKQNFKTEAEMQKYLDGLIGQQIPSFPKEVLKDKEEAQGLVFETYELPPDEARVNIELALQLDHDCIEAYEFLGIIESSTEIAMVFFE